MVLDDIVTHAVHIVYFVERLLSHLLLEHVHGTRRGQAHGIVRFRNVIARVSNGHCLAVFDERLTLACLICFLIVLRQDELSLHMVTKAIRFELFAF